MSAMHGTSGIGAPAIQGYEVVQVLGSGGMGIAYLARQEALKRLVCLKAMSISDDEDAELSRAVMTAVEEGAFGLAWRSTPSAKARRPSFGPPTREARWRRMSRCGASSLARL